MGLFSVFSFILLFMASLCLCQPNLVGANYKPNSNQKQTALKPPKTTSKFSSSWEPKPEPEQPIEASKCPEESTISPCDCYNLSGLVAIDCLGSTVDQSSIETAFREIRKVNEIPEDRGIHLHKFYLADTELTQLDLAPFYGSQMAQLILQFNYDLTQLVTSGTGTGTRNPGDEHFCIGSIHASYFYVGDSPLLKTKGFGESFKYFSNELTYFFGQGLDLNNDNNSDESEFLPGLSLHTNLKDFLLHNCNISGPLDFDSLIPKELENLGQIDLLGNNIQEIGEKAFDFKGNEDFLEIHLGLNKLNESSFHPNSGIAKNGRRTRLNLYDNQITTLPFEIFEPFLDAHSQNTIELGENPLICDARVSWLKARRGEFESQVFNAACSNDKGHFVFDSDLIP